MGAAAAAAAAAAGRRRGKSAASESGEDMFDASEVRWLISYSDYMMQLVCLFILLFSVSTFEKEKLKDIAESYQQALLGYRLPQRKYAATGPRPTVKGDRIALSNTLQEVLNALNYGRQETLEQIDSVPLAEGVKISIKDAVFEEGSAKLPETAAKVVDKAAEGLKAHGRTRVEIRGHTSVSEEETMGGDASWLLSYQRAKVVADRLLGVGTPAYPKIIPARVRVTACASHEPAAGTPAHEKGSDADRRVEIVVTEEHVPN